MRRFVCLIVFASCDGASITQGTPGLHAGAEPAPSSADIVALATAQEEAIILRALGRWTGPDVVAYRGTFAADDDRSALQVSPPLVEGDYEGDVLGAVEPFESWYDAESGTSAGGRALTLSTSDGRGTRLIRLDTGIGFASLPTRPDFGSIVMVGRCAACVPELQGDRLLIADATARGPYMGGTVAVRFGGELARVDPAALSTDEVLRLAAQDESSKNWVRALERVGDAWTLVNESWLYAPIGDGEDDCEIEARYRAQWYLSAADPTDFGVRDVVVDDAQVCCSRVDPNAHGCMPWVRECRPLD